MSFLRLLFFFGPPACLYSPGAIFDCSGSSVAPFHGANSLNSYYVASPLDDIDMVNRVAGPALIVPVNRERPTLELLVRSDSSSVYPLSCWLADGINRHQQSCTLSRRKRYLCGICWLLLSGNCSPQVPDSPSAAAAGT